MLTAFSLALVLCCQTKELQMLTLLALSRAIKRLHKKFCFQTLDAAQSMHHFREPNKS